MMDWDVSYFEFHSCSDRFEFQKVWSKSITHVSCRLLWRLIILLIVLRFGDLEKHLLSVQITDLELGELDVIDVRRWGA